MAQGSEAPSSIAVAVCLEGRDPYAMFELVKLTTATVELRGPLMLELGEQLTLRLARGSQTAEVEGRITAVARGDGDPVTTIELADGAAIAPFV